MTKLQELKEIAEMQRSEMLADAVRVIEDCYATLLKSGQLEVNPPRSLHPFCTQDKRLYDEYDDWS